MHGKVIAGITGVIVIVALVPVAVKMADKSTPAKSAAAGGNADLTTVAPSNNLLKYLPIISGEHLALPLSDSGAAAEYLLDRYLYMVFQSEIPTDILRIIDVSDPANPTLAGGADLSFPNVGKGKASGARTIVVQNKYAYIGFEEGSGSAPTDNFRVVDVSDPHKPSIINTNAA